MSLDVSLSLPKHRAPSLHADGACLDLLPLAVDSVGERRGKFYLSIYRLGYVLASMNKY